VSLLLLIALSCTGLAESLEERVKLLEERVKQLEEKLADKEGIASDGSFSLGNNWYYSTISGERDEYIEGIFLAMFPEFVRIFGADMMSHKPVTIFNEPDASAPMAIPMGKTMRIRLAQGNTSFWAQMIYQLSHEMTHYVFFAHFPHANQANYGEIEDKEKSDWNEEIICEAIALYMLKYMAENWEKCSLSKINPTFGSAIKDYLKNEYDRTENLPLKSEGEVIPLADFHKTFNRESGKNDRMAERNYLYDLFVSVEVKTIGEVFNMYKHYNKEYRSIDYAYWMKETKYPAFVEKVGGIQPKLQCLQLQCPR
jgi:hypothetical protein